MNRFSKEDFKQQAQQYLLMLNNLSGAAQKKYLAQVLEMQFWEGHDNGWWVEKELNLKEYDKMEPLDNDCE